MTALLAQLVRSLSFEPEGPRSIPALFIYLFIYLYLFHLFPRLIFTGLTALYLKSISKRKEIGH